MDLLACSNNFEPAETCLFVSFGKHTHNYISINKSNMPTNGVNFTDTCTRQHWLKAELVFNPSLTKDIRKLLTKFLSSNPSFTKTPFFFICSFFPQVFISRTWKRCYRLKAELVFNYCLTKPLENCWQGFSQATLLPFQWTSQVFIIWSLLLSELHQ